MVAKSEGYIFVIYLSSSQLNIGDSDDDQADSLAVEKDGQRTQPERCARPPPLLYLSDVAGQFGELEGEAEWYNMAEVSYPLPKANPA